jgi:hypothetical protein
MTDPELDAMADSTGGSDEDAGLQPLLRVVREELAAEGPEELEPLVRVALLAGRARHAKRAARRRAVGVLAASVAVVGIAATLALFAVPSAPPPRAERGGSPAAPVGERVAPSGARERALDDAIDPAPGLRVQTLRAGHLLTATADARYRVERGADGTAIELDRGSMLFDVQPLLPSERFVVSTPDGQVRVVGTVFAVEVSAHGTRVEVFEGRVRVELAGRTLELSEGERVGRTGGGIAALREQGRIAAAARRGAPTDGPGARRAEPMADEPSEGAVGIDVARGWIANGEPERALEAAREPAAEDAGWQLVYADALRALGRVAEAADTYDAVAQRSEGVERSQYGFLAAQIRMRRLDDPRGALVSLELAEVTHSSSPLRERGLALEVEAHYELGDRRRFEERARVYLEAYPEGSRRAWIERRSSAR